MQKILVAVILFLFFSFYQGKASAVVYDVDKATENIAMGNKDDYWSYGATAPEQELCKALKKTNTRITTNKLV